MCVVLQGRDPWAALPCLSLLGLSFLELDPFPGVLAWVSELHGGLCLAGDQGHMVLETEEGLVLVSRGERFAEEQTLAVGSWPLTFCSVGSSLSSVRFCFHMWTVDRDFLGCTGKGPGSLPRI